MTTSYSLHDKASDKFIILTCQEELTADVVLYFGKKGGRLITYEELSDVANLPEEFVTACKGTAGVSIVSIDFYGTTSPTSQQGQPGAVDTYRIKLSDGTYTSYTIYNGLRVEDTMTVDQINTAISTAVGNIIGKAPELLNSIEELANMFGNDPEAYNSLLVTVSKKADTSYVDGISKTLGDNLTALANTVNNGLDSLLDIKQNIYNKQHTLALVDRGRDVVTNSTVVIPTFASVAFPDGATIGIVNNSINKLTLTPSSGVTLIWAGTTKSGARTILNYGSVVLKKMGTNTWYVHGDLE